MDVVDVLLGGNMAEKNRGVIHNGREVESPFWTDAIGFTTLAVLVVLLPILIPLHFILTLQGRRGIFVVRSGESGEKELWVLCGGDAFEKVAR
jgi:hypothetical protein